MKILELGEEEKKKDIVCVSKILDGGGGCAKLVC